MKIKIKDSKQLRDSIKRLKKKIHDVEIDLTKPGIDSIANALMASKDGIEKASGFAALRDVVKPIIEKFDTPKAKEMLLKIEELDRLHKRDPRLGGRNDFWLWDKLLKYVYNILLKASGNESPDAAMRRERKEKEQKDSAIEGDCSVKDGYLDYRGSDCAELVRLLGEAHNCLIEAADLASDLERDDILDASILDAIDGLEADCGELDFEAAEEPVDELLARFGGEAVKEKEEISEEETLDPEDELEDYDGDAENWDLI